MMLRDFLCCLSCLCVCWFWLNVFVSFVCGALCDVALFLCLRVCMCLCACLFYVRLCVLCVMYSVTLYGVFCAGCRVFVFCGLCLCACV